MLRRETINACSLPPLSFGHLVKKLLRIPQIPTPPTSCGAGAWNLEEKEEISLKNTALNPFPLNAKHLGGSPSEARGRGAEGLTKIRNCVT